VTSLLARNQALCCARVDSTSRFARTFMLCGAVGGCAASGHSTGHSQHGPAQGASSNTDGGFSHLRRRAA
jgi:hypothetical protein